MNRTISQRCMQEGHNIQFYLIFTLEILRPSQERKVECRNVRSKGRGFSGDTSTCVSANQCHCCYSSHVLYPVQYKRSCYDETYYVIRITVLWHLTPSSMEQRRCYILVFPKWSTKVDFSTSMHGVILKKGGGESGCSSAREFTKLFCCELCKTVAYLFSQATISCVPTPYNLLWAPVFRRHTI
jgi:hypothetical protein